MKDQTENINEILGTISEKQKRDIENLIKQAQEDRITKTGMYDPKNRKDIK